MPLFRSTQEPIRLIDYETLTIENIIYLNNVTSDLHLTNFTCVNRQHKKLDDFTIESDRFQLNVTFKPKIEFIVLNEANEEYKIENNNNTNVFLYRNEASNVGFKCKYRSNPKPTNNILWFKNGLIIDNKCKK